MTIAKQQRVAVIGHTGQGNYGHDLDTAFSGVPGAAIVAVADPDETGRAGALARTGAPRGYASYEEMLREVHPDIVCVSPRHCGQHEAMVVAAAESGARGILCEKPFAATPAAADRMLEACERRGVTVFVAHRGREIPYLRWAKRLIEQEIGPLQVMRGHGKADRRAGAEDTAVLGVHIFDQMRYFAGEAAWAFGHVTQDGRDITADDVREGPEGLGHLAGNGLAAYYAFDSGVTAHYESYAGERGGSRWFGLELHCALGIIALRNLPGAEVYRYPHGLWLPAPDDGDWERIMLPEWEAIPPDGRMRESNRRYALALLAAITGDRAPDHVSTGRDALAALEMVLAPAESQRLGRRVGLPLANRANPYTALGAA